MALIYALFAKAFIRLRLQVEIAAISLGLLARRRWADDQIFYCEFFTHLRR